MILLGKRAVRVEVRSATTSTTGATQFAHNDARDAGKYDVLALVFGTGEVEYRPSLESLA